MTNGKLALYGVNITGKMISDIFYFPLWWYAGGFFQLLKYLGANLKEKEKSLALFVWIKNIFVPMYGQRDIVGAMVSLVMRIFQIIFRGILLLFWLFFSIVVAGLWLVIPLYVIYQIIFQII